MSTPSLLARLPASGSGGILKPRQDSVWNPTGLNLPGGDANIYKERTHNDVHTFRSLKAGTGITLTQGSNFITIDGATTLTATSLGGDVAVYKETVSDVLRFRGLTAGTGITLTQGANDITIDGATTLTATSLGGDADIYKETVSDVFRFRGVSAGTGISVTENATDVSIANTGLVSASSLGGTAAVYKTTTAGDAQFRGISGGNAITITQNANDISVASDLTLPGTTTDTALARWSGTGGDTLLSSSITSDGNSLVLPAAGSITTRTIQSDNAFVAVTIEDVTFLNGLTTTNDLKATNSVYISEQAALSSYQSSAGNLWVDSSGDLRYQGDKFNSVSTNLTVYTTAGDLQYASTDGNIVNTRLPIGSTDDILTVVSGLPAWRAPGLQTYQEITAVADDSTVNAISTTIQHTFIDVTSDGGAGVKAKLTLANAATKGTVKNIYCRTIANAGTDHAEVKITTYLDAAGSTGTKSFTFNNAGESVMIIWNGTQWQARDTGATLGASSF